jgi:hypothetical protein
VGPQCRQSSRHRVTNPPIDRSYCPATSVPSRSTPDGKNIAGELAPARYVPSAAILAGNQGPHRPHDVSPIAASTSGPICFLAILMSSELSMSDLLTSIARACCKTTETKPLPRPGDKIGDDVLRLSLSQSRKNSVQADSWRATTLPLLSQRVIALSGSWLTNASYSL